MNCRNLLFLLVSGLLLNLQGSRVTAGEFNRILSIGDDAPNWVGLAGTDGKTYGLKDFASHRVVVIAFTCNTCPYAVDVEARLVAMEREYAEKGVAFVAINVNIGSGDSFEAMKQRVTENGFRFPYLRDDSQQVALAYGAITTPEFYVLDRDRHVVYMGALDDSPDGKAIQHHHVKSAIESALAGETPTVKETVPIGCRIRFARKR